ncbi:MAG: M23 family metallopeptidase [Pseudomonadota bacterium]
MGSGTSKFGVIGDDAPISAAADKLAPDSREVSMRWLFGSVVTGVTSVSLMGAALFVALDGRQLLAIPPEIISARALAETRQEDASKTERIALPRSVTPPSDPERRRLSVSMLSRDGDADVVRTQPFEHLKIALAAPNDTDRSYPPFDPLKIFIDEDASEAAIEATAIYGAAVDSEASIRIYDFQPDAQMADARFDLTDDEVESLVRATAPLLADGDIEVASLSYVDPLRFGAEDPVIAATSIGNTATIMAQNISVAPQQQSLTGIGFDETAIEVASPTKIANLLDANLFDNDTFAGQEGMARAFSTLLDTDEVDAGHVLRLAFKVEKDTKSIVRASLYEGSNHIQTIALNDRDQYVPGDEPVDLGVMRDLAADDEEINEIVLLAERDLPNAYNAIYRGVLAHGLDAEMAGKIVRMVAADVDFRSRIRLNDGLELFYSVPEEGADEQESQLLYVSSRFGDTERNFYRFTNSKGETNFFDREGRSARQFMLRNPVPNGRFTSGYGMRIHPIHRYRKMHWGVDWAAPRGTPIIAPANGVVEKTHWAGGYGRTLVVRHPNGYETMYAHLAGFAKGIQPGVRVRQGQVIARVGNTGLSTGPHLHYEMRINNKRVDPMRVRLPKGITLSGDDLEAFKRERDRIDALLQDEDNSETVASL